MPPKLDNVIKSPHYFRNVNLDKVQIKFNNSEKARLWIPFVKYTCVTDVKFTRQWKSTFGVVSNCLLLSVVANNNWQKNKNKTKQKQHIN